MAEDNDPLVDEEEDQEDVEEDELPESPALVDHTVETRGAGGVTYERGPGGKLIAVPND